MTCPGDLFVYHAAPETGEMTNVNLLGSGRIIFP